MKDIPKDWAAFWIVLTFLNSFYLVWNMQTAEYGWMVIDFITLVFCFYGAMATQENAVLTGMIRELQAEYDALPPL